MYKRIRKAREEMGYTREKFAEKLDVSVSYLAEVERGKMGISVKMLLKICTVLGLSADYLLFGDTYPSENVQTISNRIEPRYRPLLKAVVRELLALSAEDGFTAEDDGDQ